MPLSVFYLGQCFSGHVVRVKKRGFSSVTSPKQIDLEGLGESLTGTKQEAANALSSVKSFKFKVFGISMNGEKLRDFQETVLNRFKTSRKIYFWSCYGPSAV